MNLRILICLILVAGISSCSNNSQTHPVPAKPTTRTFYKTKPAATFSDTLKINSVAAVFYSPDSLQLQKIRSIADSGVFESKMHEYEYLIKTAQSSVNKNFSQVKIIEAKNVRYLLFITSYKKRICIDLDKNYDPYGLYLFNRQKAPQPVDMANTETELGFYFSK
jgi:hypothetical protein